MEVSSRTPRCHMLGNKMIEAKEPLSPTTSSSTTMGSPRNSKVSFTMSTSTVTPKRRRKGGSAASSRVRYSPEKRSSVRSFVTSAGSLLDDDDQESQLAGVMIRQPIDPPTYDNMSYSDSEISAEVWEGVEDSGDDESQEVVLTFEGRRGRNYHKWPQHTDPNSTSPSQAAAAAPISPSTTDRLLEGGMIALQQNRQTQEERYRLPKAKALALAGRQVSECSELTMPETLVSESSYDSQRSSLYPSTYVRGDNYESASISASGGDYDESSTTSNATQDSGIVAEAIVNALRPCRRKKPARRHPPVAETSDTSSSWMWSYHTFPEGGVPGSISKKRKEQSHYQVGSEDGASDDHTFLFPLKHFASKPSNPTHQSDSNDILTPSLLVDLTEDLKEIAIVAGQSSGDLVASVFHQLCEDCEERKSPASDN